MSYNIDTIKVKKLENLVIPMDSFYKHEREDWHPDKEIELDGSITLYFMDSEIHGKLDGNDVIVDKFEVYGEGSGTSMNWIIEPALKDSQGELTASFVWEGGDTINQLIVKDGEIEWKDIEI